MNRSRTPKQNRKRDSLQISPGGGAAETPYSNFDIANPDKWNLDWDAKTKKLVIDRVENVPAYRFFSVQEAHLLEAFCDCALPQDDRPKAQRVPIAPWIDTRLYADEGAGYRYENMPDDRETYRMGLRAFDETAHHLFNRGFIELQVAEQKEVIHRVAEGSPPGETWKRLSPVIFFQLFMGDVITNYYAHPSAWAEIGFNGPSSPRGHIRLRLNFRDPWEAREEQARSSVDIVRRSGGKDKGPAKGGPTH